MKNARKQMKSLYDAIDESKSSPADLSFIGVLYYE